MNALTKHDVMLIANSNIDNGCGIAETNYFNSSMAKSGHFFLSIYRGFRLLIPEQLQNLKDEIKQTESTIEHVVITKGPVKVYNNDFYEIMFEDNTDKPLCIYTTDKASDFIPDDTYLNRETSLKVYYSLDDMDEYKCFFRRGKVPCKKKYESILI